jgi:hypothetical protein
VETRILLGAIHASSLPIRQVRSFGCIYTLRPPGIVLALLVMVIQSPHTALAFFGQHP